MKIGIGKLGRPVQFNSKSWGAIGGDNEPPILYENLIRNNPQHTFVMLGLSDYSRLPLADQERINEHRNFIDAFAGCSVWRKEVFMKRADVTDTIWLGSDGLATHDGNQKFMEEVIIPDPDLKVDAAILMQGMIATSNVPGHSRKRKDPSSLALPLNAQKLYSGPPIHYLNVYRDIPWIAIENDPRSTLGKARDLMNFPKRIYSQYDSICKLTSCKEYDSTEDIVTQIPQEYKGMETIFLIGKTRGEAMEQQEGSLDSFFSDAPKEVAGDVKDINFMVVCNEGLPSRYPDLKKYILDNVQDVDIYGKWNPDTIGDDNRFKGPKKFNDLQSMLPRVKYTFCIPIKKGWVTAKFWEMAHYGIIPFLHPTYDEQKHLDVPAFLRVKDSKELFDKIKFLEENPEAYDQLRDAIDKVLKDEYYDGTYMNNTLLEGIEEISTK